MCFRVSVCVRPSAASTSNVRFTSPHRVRGKMEDGSFLAAHSVVPAGTVVKSGELWAGSPARKLKDLSDKQKRQLVFQAEEYVKLGREHSGVEVLGGNVVGTGTGGAGGGEDDDVKKIGGG